MHLESCILCGIFLYPLAMQGIERIFLNTMILLPGGLQREDFERFMHAVYGTSRNAEKAIEILCANFSIA